MNNILNIDLVNKMQSVTISQSDSNKITLNILISDSLENVYLQIKNQNNSVETITDLSIGDDVIVYELPFSKYNGIGTVEIKVKNNDGYESEAITINSSTVNVTTDKLEIKYDENTAIYNLRKLNLNKYKDMPMATTYSLGAVMVGDNLEIDANGRLNAKGGGTTVKIIRYEEE